MFNNYMWQTYLNAGGKDVVENFKAVVEDDDFVNFGKEIYCVLIKNLHSNFCPSKVKNDIVNNQLFELFSDIENGDFLYGCDNLIGLSEGEYSIKTIINLFYNGLIDDGTSEQVAFEEFASEVNYYTTFCYMMFPELFIPYYFQCNFNILGKISQEFGIELPPIPVKKDYKGRLYYYGEICSVLYEFREEHNMSPYELCAFLYDFAPKYIGGIDSYIIKDLPEPKSAFFIGGSKDDIFLDESKDVITCWQCNPNAKSGDIAVMYIRTPISAVDSQWRCVSDGFIDPFFYYYRCTYISKPHKISRISQKALESDSVFKKLPIVRKNMQGINGVELQPSEYNHLMDMANAAVPRLEFIVTQTGIELMSENDVKDKLIRNLIKKLGYNDNEYKAELRLEIGNHNNMIIPDFVLLPNETRGKQSAFTIIEAKYNINGNKEFEDTIIQARSYARQCIAKYSVITDRNKFWLYSSDDDYTNVIFVSTWDELNNTDIFYRLNKIIGKK